MTAGRLRLTGLALAAICGGLGWSCFGLATAPVSIGQIPPSDPWAPDFRIVEAVASFGSEVDPAILARLVFSPTRRPPQVRPPDPVAPETQESAAQTAPEVTEPQGAVLQGVFIDAGRRAALVTSPNHPDGIWLGIGGEFEGWSLRRIEADKLVLGQGAREIPLTLYVDNSGK